MNSFAIKNLLRTVLPTTACAILGALSTSACGEESVDFARHVQPILERHCLACHGPDKQEGGLRLDVRQTGLQGGDNYAPAIVPGRSDSSPLFQFISREDADLRMPPKGSRLNATEVDTIRHWIDQGATWPDDSSPLAIRDAKHWSFQPLRRPPIPVEPHRDNGVADPRAAAIGNAIDSFVIDRLTAAGLTLSPPADRRTLIRRLYLVVLGLPPTPAEVEAFVGDESPDAWPRLVDVVLANPSYGERWAQHWLDLVRFGETNGFETNRERPTAWHYRDYTIDALNRDLPYDQFVREQVAGDALGRDVATGFLVAGAMDLVKSQDINLTRMQRQDELTDIVNTTGTAILALTLGCARCHNHKFDPITQRDFYALQAVFAGVQHGDRPLPATARQAEQMAALQHRISQLEELLAPFAAARVAADGQAAMSGQRTPVTPTKNVERIAATPVRWLRFTVLATNSGSEPCLDELAAFAEANNVTLASNGTTARCSSTLPGNALHQLAHVNDGLYGNGHSWISNEPGAGWVELELLRVTPIDRIEWGRDLEGKYQDRLATRYRIEGAVEPGQWRLLASSDDRAPYVASSAEPPYRFDRAPPEAAQQGREWLQELTSSRKRHAELVQELNAYIGKFESPGPTHRLFRGDPAAPKEEVDPDTIAVLGKLGLDRSATEQQRRVALARWLTSPDNPLPARVWVNRLWQFHFGRGLVDTPNDFGANGAAPSHPELLDWLACELIASGWSTKRIQRRILLSRTWQQDSRPTPLGLAMDANCRWWWRFPPRRLEAEAIRDGILAVTGVLDQRAGGPGFAGFEVQLENVRHYFPKTEFGPRDWRRMIYMTKVRMEKESTFGAFDCPDASQVVSRRTRSTTPLQALNLLNGEFLLQQAELLGERLRREAGSRPADQARQAFWLCFNREPNEQELVQSVEFIRSVGLHAFCRAMLNANELLFIP